MNYTFPIDNFECSLSQTDESLTIKAEDLSSNNRFSKTLNNDDAKAASTGHFFDIHTIYQVLKDFFENKSDKVSLSIANDGKLTYNCQVLFGTVARQFGFTIALEKEDEEPLKKMEKTISKLLVRVSELEKGAKIKEECACKSELEKILKVNDERFKTFEKLFLERWERIESILVKTEQRVEMLEKCKNKKDSDGTKDLSVQYRFNPSSQFADKYDLTNNNKTAKLNVEGFYPIFADRHLQKSEKSKVSFLIEHIDGSGLGVGISNRDVFLQQVAYSVKGSVMYFSRGETYFYTDESSKQDVLPLLKKGDKVSFVADMMTGEIAILLNDKQVGTHTFEKADLESKEFFPFIHCQSVDNGATFI